MAWAVKSRQLINIGLDMRVAWAAKSRQFSNTGVTITTKNDIKNNVPGTADRGNQVAPVKWLSLTACL